jgi:hypothetical protein
MKMDAQPYPSVWMVPVDSANSLISAWPSSPPHLHIFLPAHALKKPRNEIQA